MDLPHFLSPPLFITSIKYLYFCNKFTLRLSTKNIGNRLSVITTRHGKNSFYHRFVIKHNGTMHFVNRLHKGTSKRVATAS